MENKVGKEDTGDGGSRSLQFPRQSITLHSRWLLGWAARPLLEILTDSRPPS